MVDISELSCRNINIGSENWASPRSLYSTNVNPYLYEIALLAHIIYGALTPEERLVKKL
jgi:hypothetical protein